MIDLFAEVKALFPNVEGVTVNAGRGAQGVRNGKLTVTGLVALLMFGLGACPEVPGPTDASDPAGDAAVSDATQADTADPTSDAAVNDATPADTTKPDIANPDRPAPDAAVQDTAMPDTLADDSRVPDVRQTDAGPEDAHATAPGCGNEIIEIGEQCDDGNEIPDDGCSNCMYAVPQNTDQIHWIDMNASSCTDSGNGQSAPWCNILPMDSHTFVPGDSVVIRAGDYNAYGRDRSGFSHSSAPYEDADVRIRDDGTADHPIVIMGYPGELVIFRNELDPVVGEGFYPPSWGYNVFGTSNADHVIFQGVTVYGTVVSMYSNHDIFRGNRFFGIGAREPWSGNNYAGLGIVASWFNLVQANHFEGYRGQGNHNNCGLQLWGYDLVHPGGDNNISENNEFRDNVAAIYDKDNSRNNIHRKNYFQGNSVAMKIASQHNCYNVSMYQNLVVDNGAGILAEYGPGNHIYNNVFIGTSGFSHTYPNVDFETSFYNNILVPDGDDILAIGTNCPFPSPMDNNLYYPFTRVTYDYGVYASSLSQWQSHGNDLDGLEADPLFLDDQYHLDLSSPARGVGVSGQDLGLYPDGNERVVIGRP